MLRCSGCQQNKPEDCFYKEKYRSRGYSIWCKECSLRRERIRRGVDPNRPNPGSFDRKSHSKNYREAHKDYYTAKSAERRMKKRNFPLTIEQRKQINDIYKQARIEGKVVDHIHPINHPLLCGLHVPWNLQLLTPEENARKGNKIILE